MNGAALQIVRHDSDTGRWEYVRATPHPQLDGLVLGYTGFAQEHASFARRRELPKDSISMIISLDSPVCVTDPREPDVVNCLDGPFVTGFWDTFAITELDPNWSGLQIDFTPPGAYLFFGLPLDVLHNRVVALEGVFDARTVRVLQGRLYDRQEWVDRFALLDSFWMRRLRQGKYVDDEVRWAWRQLHESGGRADIRDLTKYLGWSHKNLIARFRHQIGRTPKLLGRIIRLECVLRDLRTANAPIRWTELALHHGYYDQSHLVRDFRQFTGSPPTDFVRRMVPDGGGVSGD